MKILPSLLSVIGGGASVVKSASNVALIVGAIYLADCRINSKAQESVDRCYFTALPLMGIGVAGRGGFEVGFNTLNPALRRPEDEAPAEGAKRDGKGRFTANH